MTPNRPDGDSAPLPRSAGAGIHPGPEGPGTLPEGKVDGLVFDRLVNGGAVAAEEVRGLVASALR